MPALRAPSGETLIAEDRVELVPRFLVPVSEAKRLRALEDESGRLKRLLANTMLANAGLNDLLSKKKMVTPAAKREAFAHLQALHDVSEWRACNRATIVGVR